MKANSLINLLEVAASRWKLSHSVANNAAFSELLEFVTEYFKLLDSCVLVKHDKKYNHSILTYSGDFNRYVFLGTFMTRTNHLGVNYSDEKFGLIIQYKDCTIETHWNNPNSFTVTITAG